MKINSNPSVQEVRKFATVWMAAAALAGGLFFWRHHPSIARVFWTASACVGLSGILAVPVARQFYRGWMSLAAAINLVITRLLLILIYWGVMTPLALVFKITGRDALKLKKSKSDATYWRDLEKLTDISYYRHLY